MNKYLILLVCVCMGIMFYMLSQRIDQSEKAGIIMARTLYRDIYAGERNRHRFDRSLKRIDDNFEIQHQNDLWLKQEIDKLFTKQVSTDAQESKLYPCVTTGMYIKD